MARGAARGARDDSSDDLEPGRLREASDEPVIEPLDPNLQIRLPEFEGPLDLLWHLIKKHKLNVLDLPMVTVTEAYMQYLGLMQSFNLDIAAEYLLMAATLAHIKSKMLLPAPPEDQDEPQDDELELDPREELVRRLLEYQKYKAAGDELLARGLEGKDVFVRGSQPPEASGKPPLAELSLFALMDAFQAVLKRANAQLAFEITAERVSIQERMLQITERLKGRPSCVFEELFDGMTTTIDIVITFLALLEMAKSRLAQVYQSDRDMGIHVRLLVTDAATDPASIPVPTSDQPSDLQ